MGDVTVYERLCAALAPVAQQLAQTVAAFEIYAEAIRESAEKWSEEVGDKTLEACDAIAQSTCGLSTNDFESLQEWVDSVRALMSKLAREDCTPEPIRKWPRAKNERLQPLLLDRRPKLYRCRNNC